MVCGFKPLISPGWGEYGTERGKQCCGNLKGAPVPWDFEKEKVSILCVCLLPTNTLSHTHPQIQTLRLTLRVTTKQAQPASEQIHQKLVQSDLSKFRENLGVSKLKFPWPPEATAEREGGWTLRSFKDSESVNGVETQCLKPSERGLLLWTRPKN